MSSLHTLLRPASANARSGSARNAALASMSRSRLRMKSSRLWVMAMTVTLPFASGRAACPSAVVAQTLCPRWRHAIGDRTGLPVRRIRGLTAFEIGGWGCARSLTERVLLAIRRPGIVEDRRRTALQGEAYADGLLARDRCGWHGHGGSVMPGG